MNEISKKNIQERLNKAIETEGLRIDEAAGCLGVLPTYVSMIRNEMHWDKCSAVAWDAVQKWTNSGQSLKEYSEKHGKVVIDKPRIQLPLKVVSVKPAEKEEPKGAGFDMTFRTPGTEVKANQVVNNSVICIDIEINLIVNGKKITL